MPSTFFPPTDSDPARVCTALYMEQRCHTLKALQKWVSAHIFQGDDNPRVIEHRHRFGSRRMLREVEYRLVYGAHKHTTPYCASETVETLNCVSVTATTFSRISSFYLLGTSLKSSSSQSSTRHHVHSSCSHFMHGILPLFRIHHRTTLHKMHPINFPAPPRADCLAALKMIPDGSLRPGPVMGNQPSFLLPDSVRDPKQFSLPAVFWSGGCAIEIWCNNDPPKMQRADFALVLYSTVWPEMRWLARMIIDKCIGNGPGSGRITFPAVERLE